MKTILDRALAGVLSEVKGLRAVVLSVAPDGLIAWSWSDNDKHEIALGFAALDRAATVCLESLGASQGSRSLLLTASDSWVASWPLFDLEGLGDVEIRQRLVITTVFAGELQNGMVMVYGSRVRRHIREAVKVVREDEDEDMRAALVEHVRAADDGAMAVQRLAAELDIEVRRLGCPEQLGARERQRLKQWVRGSMGAGPRLLQ